jgi:hypothetical protein
VRAKNYFEEGEIIGVIQFMIGKVNLIIISAFFERIEKRVKNKLFSLPQVYENSLQCSMLKKPLCTPGNCFHFLIVPFT